MSRSKPNCNRRRVTTVSIQPMTLHRRERPPLRSCFSNNSTSMESALGIPKSVEFLNFKFRPSNYYSYRVNCRNILKDSRMFRDEITHQKEDFFSRRQAENANRPEYAPFRFPQFLPFCVHLFIYIDYCSPIVNRRLS